MYPHTPLCRFRVDLDASGGGVGVLGMSGRPRGAVRTKSGDLREAARFAVIDRPCLAISGDCEDSQGALEAWAGCGSL